MNELRFGYNTNGFAHHCLPSAVGIIYGLGYRSVALTLDHYALDPTNRKACSPGSLRKWRRFFAGLRLSVVIETGARFLLNPMRKHQPTLLNHRPRERQRRFEFIKQSIDIARQVGSNTVSLWSGTPVDPVPPATLMRRLVIACRKLSDYAAAKSVRLAFEPEPGMFIDTMTKFEELFDRVNHPAFGLTLDIGHLHCMGETPIEDHIRRWKDVLWNVHIEDMRRGVHDHLMFGEGEIDFPPVLRALREVGYAGGVHVELSRHSHDAVETARKALAFLRSCK